LIMGSALRAYQLKDDSECTASQIMPQDFFFPEQPDYVPEPVYQPKTCREYTDIMECVRQECESEGTVPLYHYTIMAVADLIMHGGFRMSTQGQGDGGMYFSTLGPSSYELGSPKYEENIIIDCFGKERLEEYRGKHKLDVVFIYGVNPKCIEQAPGGRENAKMISKATFEGFSTPTLDGNYFLRPDYIKAALLIDGTTEYPSNREEVLFELDLEKEKDKEVQLKLKAMEKELIENSLSVQQALAMLDDDKKAKLTTTDGADREARSASVTSQSQERSTQSKSLPRRSTGGGGRRRSSGGSGSGTPSRRGSGWSIMHALGFTHEEKEDLDGGIELTHDDVEQGKLPKNVHHDDSDDGDDDEADRSAFTTEHTLSALMKLHGQTSDIPAKEIDLDLDDDDDNEYTEVDHNNKDVKDVRPATRDQSFADMSKEKTNSREEFESKIKNQVHHPDILTKTQMGENGKSAKEEEEPVGNVDVMPALTTSHTEGGEDGEGVAATSSPSLAVIKHVTNDDDDDDDDAVSMKEPWSLGDEEDSSYIAPPATSLVHESNAKKNNLLLPGGGGGGSAGGGVEFKYRSTISSVRRKVASTPVVQKSAVVQRTPPSSSSFKEEEGEGGEEEGEKLKQPTQPVSSSSSMMQEAVLPSEKLSSGGEAKVVVLHEVDQQAGASRGALKDRMTRLSAATTTASGGGRGGDGRGFSSIAGRGRSGGRGRGRGRSGIVGSSSMAVGGGGGGGSLQSQEEWEAERDVLQRQMEDTDRSIRRGSVQISDNLKGTRSVAMKNKEKQWANMLSKSDEVDE
jgi:hypothetical protein